MKNNYFPIETWCLEFNLLHNFHLSQTKLENLSTVVSINKKWMKTVSMWSQTSIVYRAICLSLLRITHPHFRWCVENAKQSWYCTHTWTLKLHTNTSRLLSCPIFTTASLSHTPPYTRTAINGCLCHEHHNTILHRHECVICAYTYESVIPHQTKANSSEKVYQSWS